MLLQAMESQREDLVVILAGYKDRMDEFFRSNPGVRSRIAHHLEFPDYALDELMQIAEAMLLQQQYRFDDAAREAFHTYVARRSAQPDFANARSIRNAIDRIKLRQANRLYSAGGVASKDDLARIDALDILQSRVFLEAPEPPSAEPPGQRNR